LETLRGLSGKNGNMVLNRPLESHVSGYLVKNPAPLIIGLTLPLTLMVGCSKPAPTIEVILSGLDNPRGIAVSPTGEMFLAEAGTGYAAIDPTQLTGKFTKYTDLNNDGDFDDEGEAKRWFSHFPTYNALHFYGIQQDEVSGPGDVILHRDGRIYLSVDGGLDEIALYEISPEGRIGRNLADRSNMNSIAFDRTQERIYTVESTANQLIEITLESGALRVIVVFPLLEYGQQAVPAGLCVDPRTGDVLVAFFSGARVNNETQVGIPVIPKAAKVVRVDPKTGNFADEITDLTTAIDVAIDERGNIFVVEMASGYADLLPKTFDLFDPDASPLHGGYLRFSGSVTLYPVDGSSPQVLADGLDMPTNITLSPDGALFISTGQGTPGRSIPSLGGSTRIVGKIVRITDY